MAIARQDVDPSVFGGAVPHTFERFDGAEWQSYETQDAAVTLTSSGRSLLAAQHVVEALVRYADDAQADRESSAGNRRYIGEGNNARVYAVSDLPLAIKEKHPGSHENLMLSLDRMDNIAYAIETSCPRWISIPKQYGVLVPKADESRQYLLMEKVDEGVTLGDIIEPREDHLSQTALDTLAETFGDTTDLERERLLEKHDLFKTVLREALYHIGLAPDSFLTDIGNQNQYNVIVEPLETPIASSACKFTVIDQ